MLPNGPRILGLADLNVVSGQVLIRLGLRSVRVPAQPAQPVPGWQPRLTIPGDRPLSLSVNTRTDKVESAGDVGTDETEPPLTGQATKMLAAPTLVSRRLTWPVILA